MEKKNLNYRRPNTVYFGYFITLMRNKYGLTMEYLKTGLSDVRNDYKESHFDFVMYFAENIKPNFYPTEK